jgi:hypothetical protein
MHRGDPQRQINEGDIRVMANKAAQRILQGHSVFVNSSKHVRVEGLEAHLEVGMFADEHQLTHIIAEALKEYWGVK